MELYLIMSILVMLETFAVGCIVIYYGNKNLYQNNNKDHKETNKKRSCDECELVRSAFREGKQEGESQTLEVANDFLRKWSIERKKREKEIFDEVFAILTKCISEDGFFVETDSDVSINGNVLWYELEKLANKYDVEVKSEE